MGVSRRISAVPREFKVGKTVVFVAHRKAIETTRDGKTEYTPAIFQAFVPSRVEYVLKGKETPEELEALEKRGLTLVNVIKQETELQLTN